MIEYEKYFWLISCGLAVCSVSVFAQMEDEEFEWSSLDDPAAELLPDTGSLDLDLGEDDEFQWDEEEPSGPRDSERGKQKTDDRGQRPEDRRQKTEDRGQGTDDRGQKAEDMPAAPVNKLPDLPAEQKIEDHVTPNVASSGQRVVEPVASQNDAAYGELLRENLDLRKKMVKLAQASESAQKKVVEANLEKEQLVGVVQNLESSLNEMTDRIDNIKSEQSKSTDNLDRTVELEKQLTLAEEEKRSLARELDVARGKADDNASKIKSGSDLFKQIELENVKMKNKLVELESARQFAKAEIEKTRHQAEKESKEARRIREQAERDIANIKDKERQLKDELSDVKSKDKDRRKLIEKMMDQIPGLEQELVRLSSEVVEQEAMIGSKDKDIELLRSELDRRDRRFVKAERMAELLEEARAEVKQVSNVEKRDMHYNMAVVYAKEGRHRDAEREYLRALKLDPTDPSVHYNLGILYEDEFGDSQKAALHYKKYLKLAPYANDSDIVKQWLFDIEMGQ